MKLGRHVLQVNMYRLTESAFNMNHTFKMAAMSSFRAEKCCHLVSAHAVSAWRICLRPPVPDPSYISTCYFYSCIDSLLLLALAIIIHMCIYYITYRIGSSSFIFI